MEEKTGRPIRPERYLSLKGGGATVAKTSKNKTTTNKTNRQDKRRCPKERT